ncbi:MAG: hypothetical protein GY849_24710 [Deltaproteobacteria bacterium]|nr:hypothetical protein [Deltaproteobacteria bacterium]
MKSTANQQKTDATRGDHAFPMHALGTLIIVLTLSMAISLALPFQATAGKMEIRSIGIPDTVDGNMAEVNFQMAFDDAPLMFFNATVTGDNPCSVRIVAIDKDGFTITTVEPAPLDGPHQGQQVSYIAIEPGKHYLSDDGMHMTAGFTPTDAVQHGSGVPGPEWWKSILFDSPFLAAPAMLAQIQSGYNEIAMLPDEPSEPWLTTAVQNVTISGADLALERSQVPLGTVFSPETIGFLAMEANIQGSLIDDFGTTVQYETIRTGNAIQGMDDGDGCFEFDYQNTYPVLPGTALSLRPRAMASLATHNGDDGGWLRRCRLASFTQVGLVIDEDQYGDPERNHGLQAASIFVFEKDVFLSTPTRAVISSFKSYEEGGRAVVEWRTASEMGTIGFFLKRLDEKRGKYAPVNKKLLPGLLHALRGGVYRFIDKGASPGNTYTYKLVEVDGKGRKRTHGPFTITVEREGIDFAKGKGLRSIRKAVSSPYSKEAHKVSDAMKTRIKARKKARNAARALKIEQKGTAAKISIVENGLYYLDASDIAEVLAIPDNRLSSSANRLSAPVDTIRAWIQKSRLSLSNRGRKVAYWPAPGNAGIYFYGEAIDSLYTRENIYRLTKGRGLKMAVIGGEEDPGPSSGDETFAEALHIEVDFYPLSAYFQNPEADYWAWEYIIAGSSEKSFTMPSKGAADSGTAELTVNIAWATDTEANPDHHAVFTLNGVEIGEQSWDGDDVREVTLSFDQSLLNDGDNTLEVSALLDPGVPYGHFMVDSIDLTYQRRYQAVDDRLFCRGHGNEVITVNGFTGQDIHVFDLSRPAMPKLVKAVTVDEAGSAYRVSFSPADPEALYLAVGMGAAPPVSLVVDTPSQLKETQNGAEYVVITPSELKAAAQGLADYRETRGLSSMVVDLEDIYDEFNYGIASPKAIHAFLSHAYENWSPAPQYVVLAGNGNFDYKDNRGYGDNLVPTLMVNTPYGIFASDNRLADVEGDDGVPEMAIGRLPVMTSQEVEWAVDKIAAYESGAGGAWTGKVLMVADNPDTGGDFPGDSDEAALLLAPKYTMEKIYLNEHPLGDARQLIEDGIHHGALLLNYFGHGGADRLANEGMLTKTDALSLENGNKLPVMTFMTCSAGRFAIPGYDSLAEALVLNDLGGAAAVWAPTGLSSNILAKILDGQFLKAVLDGEKVVGRAVLRALEGFALREKGNYMLDIYNLLGDPALQMK